MHKWCRDQRMFLHFDDNARVFELSAWLDNVDTAYEPRGQWNNENVKVIKYREVAHALGEDDDIWIDDEALWACLTSRITDAMMELMLGEDGIRLSIEHALPYLDLTYLDN